MANNLQEEINSVKILNNTYDKQVIHDRLKHEWQSSFSYIMNMQKEAEIFEHLHYISNTENANNPKDIGDIYIDKAGYCRFDFNYSIIVQSVRDRYRSSIFYGKNINIDNIALNPEIFQVIPMVVIDGKVIWDYKIKINVDTTTIILPFTRKFALEYGPEGETIILDHHVDVYIFKNTFYDRSTININYFTKDGDKFKLNYPVDEMYKNSEIYAQNALKNEFYTFNNISTDTVLNTSQKKKYDNYASHKRGISNLPTDEYGQCFASFHFPNSIKKGYELSTDFIVPIYLDGDHYISNELSDILCDKIGTIGTDFYISVIFIKDLKSYQNKNNNYEKFVLKNEMQFIKRLDDCTLPIPLHNFLVLYDSIENETKTHLLECGDNSNFKQYFPNMYSIQPTEEERKCSIFCFYHHYDGMKLNVNTTPLYYYIESLTAEDLTQIYNNRESDTSYLNWDLISSLIDTDKVFKYGEMDFIYNHTLIDNHKDDTPEEYKVETFKEWILDNPNILRNYVKSQNTIPTNRYLWCTSVDLESRIRYNTEDELDDFTEFSEPHYVFASTQNIFNPLTDKYIIYIDGLEISDTYQRTHSFIDYIYIPCKYIKNDSFIELEFNKGFEYSKEFELKDSTEYEIFDFSEYDNSLKLVLADISFETSKNNRLSLSDKNVLEDKILNIEINDAEGNWVSIYDNNKDKDYNMFLPLNKIKVGYRDDSYVDTYGSTLKINVSKSQVIHRIDCDKVTGFSVAMIPNPNFKFNDTSMKVFKNGRLLRRHQYTINHPTSANEYTSDTVNLDRLFIYLKEYDTKTDVIDVVVSPFYYNELLYLEKLEPTEVTDSTSEYGNDVIVSLDEYITKPFDYNYYEVYLNGRKLRPDNIYIIDDTHIMLKNIESLDHFVLYEKERGYEYFGINYRLNKYNSVLPFINELNDKVKLDGSLISEKQKFINKFIIEAQKNQYYNSIRENVAYTEENIVKDFTMFDIGYAYMQFYKFYYNKLTSLQFINPDSYQTYDYRENTISENFEDIDTLYILNGTADTNKVFYLDPDKEVVFTDKNKIIGTPSYSKNDDYFKDPNPSTGSTKNNDVTDMYQEIIPENVTMLRQYPMFDYYETAEEDDEIFDENTLSMLHMLSIDASVVDTMDEEPESGPVQLTSSFSIPYDEINEAIQNGYSSIYFSEIPLVFASNANVYPNKMTVTITTNDDVWTTQEMYVVNCGTTSKVISGKDSAKIIWLDSDIFTEMEIILPTDTVSSDLSISVVGEWYTSESVEFPAYFALTNDNAYNYRKTIRMQSYEDIDRRSMVTYVFNGNLKRNMEGIVTTLSFDVFDEQYEVSQSSYEAAGYYNVFRLSTKIPSDEINDAIAAGYSAIHFDVLPVFTIGHSQTNDYLNYELIFLPGNNWSGQDVPIYSVKKDGDDDSTISYIMNNAENSTNVVSNVSMADLENFTNYEIGLPTNPVDCDLVIHLRIYHKLLRTNYNKPYVTYMFNPESNKYTYTKSTIKRYSNPNYIDTSIVRTANTVSRSGVGGTHSMELTKSQGVARGLFNYDDQPSATCTYTAEVYVRIPFEEVNKALKNGYNIIDLCDEYYNFWCIPSSGIAIDTWKWTARLDNSGENGQTRPSYNTNYFDVERNPGKNGSKRTTAKYYYSGSDDVVYYCGHVASNNIDFVDDYGTGGHSYIVINTSSIPSDIILTLRMHWRSVTFGTYNKSTYDNVLIGLSMEGTYHYKYLNVNKYALSTMSLRESDVVSLDDDKEMSLYELDDNSAEKEKFTLYYMLGHQGYIDKSETSMDIKKDIQTEYPITLSDVSELDK